ncbi:peptidoglycan DD-metalloendopeptidase family protein [Sporolactobacillus kofuensis]|uniref:Peptidoglycan DD-metalloendopeptidase family protein n=1 Tax=Sporolactobacillus kofuensis TaxID=269672 RepID=A0ABW1WD59_9BACL|nr:M23 family metallopeptidase [Sporolactobacillus kofuensis]MCO7175585.1 M23 family metallopeptidase [Sporolactobacillus kofuensis]
MSALMDYKKRHLDRKRKKLMALHSYPKAYQEPKQTSHYRNGSPYWEFPDEPKRPQVNPTRRFLVQCMVSAMLVGSVYWVNTSGGSHFHALKSSVQTAMTQEFQFVAVSNWYEKNLGDPMSFLPSFSSKTTQSATTDHSLSAENKQSSFAEPVIGEVKSPYSNTTKGVTVETSSHSSVRAVKDGLVVFVGHKKNIGETVIIQHKDSDESWYGKLDKANVKVYQEVKKGQNIGITSGKDKKGTVYFALKKGEKFIDPIQVMSFE